MKNKILISIAVLMCLILSYQLCITSIDTRYAKQLSKVLQTYDIGKIDDFFDQDTQFIYQGTCASYQEIRPNLVAACKEQKYFFSSGSSYGYGNNHFVRGIQKVHVSLHGTWNQIPFGDCKIEMKIQKKGILSFRISSLECDDPVFGYIFKGYL